MKVVQLPCKHQVLVRFRAGAPHQDSHTTVRCATVSAQLPCRSAWRGLPRRTAEPSRQRCVSYLAGQRHRPWVRPRVVVTDRLFGALANAYEACGPIPAAACRKNSYMKIRIAPILGIAGPSYDGALTSSLLARGFPASPLRALAFFFCVVRRDICPSMGRISVALARGPRGQRARPELKARHDTNPRIGGIGSGFGIARFVGPHRGIDQCASFDAAWSSLAGRRADDLAVASPDLAPWPVWPIRSFG